MTGQKKGAGKGKKPEEPPSKIPLQLVVLQKAIDEGRKELNDGEFWHCAKILQGLVWFLDSDKTLCSHLDIKPIDGFFELREKGGLLGRKNMRFFFQAYPDRGEIVVAKTYRKDEDGQTSRPVVINVRTRLSRYVSGHETVGTRYRVRRE